MCTRPTAPGKLISDNITFIRHILKSLAHWVYLISTDQEKAFDRIECQYLWQTLKKLFGQGFSAEILLLYCKIARILKLIMAWQHLLLSRGGYDRDALFLGCCIPSPLKLCNTNSGECSQVSGVFFPGCKSAVKLLAFADDAVIIIKKQRDNNFLGEDLAFFFAVLDCNISLEELTVAMGQMAAGKAPGLDGLPTIFICTSGSVWEPTCVRCSQTGLHQHPVGMQFFHFLDLALLRNWRPVALLCTDYKLFSKVLTNRFKNVLES